MKLFEDDHDYQAFERVLEEAHERTPLRILDYTVMPNHWHLVLWPHTDTDVSEFLRWLTVTHTMRWHSHFDSIGSGHLYQGRFKSFPVQDDDHLLSLLSLLRYVERNPVRAGLAERAEQWRWGSAWRREHGDARSKRLLSAWPLRRPRGWLNRVNEPQTEAELTALRKCVSRGAPLGSEQWVKRSVKRLGLGSTLRPRGRPPEKPPKRDLNPL